MLERRGKKSFLATIPRGGKLLDVGCGNDSPHRIRQMRPDIEYTGIDVADYNQSSQSLAEGYIRATPESFPRDIARFVQCFDAVLSSHNIEHCDDPDAVLLAMLRAVKPGGALFLSFPSEMSVTFPRRAGCLNFFDDATHQRLPEYSRIVESISNSGFVIEFEARQYRPLLQFLVGLLLEPLSALTRRVMIGTWALYGFESIIWARRPQSSSAKPPPAFP